MLLQTDRKALYICPIFGDLYKRNNDSWGAGSLTVAMCPPLCRSPMSAHALTLRPKWNVNLGSRHDKEALHCNRAGYPREYPGQGASRGHGERTGTHTAGIELAIQCGQVSRCCRGQLAKATIYKIIMAYITKKPQKGLGCLLLGGDADRHVWLNHAPFRVFCFSAHVTTHTDLLA